MTNGEAKIKIRKILMEEIDKLPSHYDADIGEQVFDNTAEFNELLELNKIVSEAFVALEKQTTRYEHIYPRVTYWGKHKHGFKCKTCGLTIEFVDNHTAQYKFCPSCGREINWSKPKGDSYDFAIIDEAAIQKGNKDD